MQANDDNENEDGAVEGLVDLDEANPYQGAPIHREEEFLNSKLVNSETFDESLLWKPFQTCSDAYATLELESFVNNKVNGTFQLARGGNICRVVCRGDVGRIKWNKVLKKHQPISNGQDAHICSYRDRMRTFARTVRTSEKSVRRMAIIIGSSIQNTRSLHTTPGVVWVLSTVLATLRYERES